ncbi:MAG: hypothetical protein WCX82_01235 [archaeon]|jgi:hypothetical protein
MVDIKLIKDTINELLEANVDKDTIFATLRDIGVDQADIDKYYSEITSGPKEEAPVAKIEEKPKSVDLPKVDLPKPTTTTEELENATNDVINSSLSSEPEKEIIFKTPEPIANTTFDTTELKKQISELEEKIIDIKAQMNGLTKIMKDILEENRNILNKMK